jgi:hypothetical protein
MPRYHFHLYDGRRFMDPKGVEFADEQAAREHGARLQKASLAPSAMFPDNTSRSPTRPAAKSRAATSRASKNAIAAAMAAAAHRRKLPGSQDGTISPSPNCRVQENELAEGKDAVDGD